jgi:flagellar biosynthesis/type III secretory pathway chaperone
MNERSRAAAAELTPIALVERIMVLSEQLTQIVARETEYLETRQPLKISELQEEKTRLANEYAMDIQAIRLRKELIDRAPAEKVGRLKVMMAKLDATLTANRNALAATKSVSERILKSVADAVNEHKAPMLGYGRNAAVERPRASQSAALAIDARA